MRKVLITLASAAALAMLGVALPSGAQTTSTDSTTTTTEYVTPGMVDALLITGSPSCTAAGSYEITWSLENVWTTSIGFISAYSQRFYGPYELHGDTPEPLQLSPIEPGATQVVVTTFPGGSPGTAVLQTEAMFGTDGSTGGPVPGQVRIDGTCGQVVAEATPNYTG